MTAHDVIEGEVTREVVLAPPAPPTIFGTTNPMQIVERTVAIADALGGIIKEKGMSSRISGRDYVRIEGWSFMGSMLGVFPKAVRVATMRDDTGIVCGFEAEVHLVTRAGEVVGGAIAECTRFEAQWSFDPPPTRDGRPQTARDDFALKSMAQTRATGKAYRMSFGFVMAAAGYEATPAEEMPPEGAERPSGARSAHAPPVRPPVARQEPEKRNGVLLPLSLVTVGDLLQSAKYHYNAAPEDVCNVVGAAGVAGVRPAIDERFDGSFDAAWDAVRATLAIDEPEPAVPVVG